MTVGHGGTAVEEIGMPNQSLAASRQVELRFQLELLDGILPPWLEKGLGMAFGGDLIRGEAEAGGAEVGETMTTGIIDERTAVRLNIGQGNPYATHETLGFGVKVHSVAVVGLLTTHSEIEGLEGERITTINLAQ
jgi:hypothetical protein